VATHPSSDRRSGRIRQPDTEVVVVGPGVSRVERLVPASEALGSLGWLTLAARRLLHRIVDGLARCFGGRAGAAQVTRSAFRVGTSATAEVAIPAELLGGRRELALVQLTEERPHLTLVPGMQGTIEIGVSRLDAAAILGDPRLRQASGEARFPLPWGARVNLELGPWRFTIRPAERAASSI
jgi:hypothetical protein